MPAPPRRREKNRQQESWQVFYGDVQVGWIGERAGVPKGVEQWDWYCGFVPLTHRGLSANGVAESLDQVAVLLRPHGETTCPYAQRPTLTSTVSSVRTKHGS